MFRALRIERLFSYANAEGNQLFALINLSSFWRVARINTNSVRTGVQQSRSAKWGYYSGDPILKWNQMADNEPS